MLRFIRKFVGKRRFWSYEVWNVEEASREMLVLRLQHVSSRCSGFLLASLCLWGKLQNLSFSKVSKQVVMWFCVAGVALRDILMRPQTCWKSFVWKAQYFCVLYTLHSTHYTSHSTLHFTLDAPHFTLYTPHFTLCTPPLPHSTV